MIDVVLVIADPLARLGLRTGLDSSSVARTAAVAEDPEELDEILPRFPAPILILDVVYRREDRLLVPRLTRRHPECAILMWVRHDARECVLRGLLETGSRTRLSAAALRRLDDCCLTALDGKARGCLPADAGADDVIRAVEAVHRGDIAAAPWVTAAVRHQHGELRDEPAITPRELEVMALVSEGCSNKQIARRLSIREQTVKNHLRSLMPKMGVGSRLELGLKAQGLNLRLNED